SARDGHLGSRNFLLDDLYGAGREVSHPGLPHVVVQDHGRGKGHRALREQARHQGWRDDGRRALYVVGSGVSRVVWNCADDADQFRLSRKPDAGKDRSSFGFVALRSLCVSTPSAVNRFNSVEFISRTRVLSTSIGLMEATRRSRK